MDEELKAQIIPIIENTKEGLAKAVDFLCEQSPILVKEILWWHGTRSAIVFLFTLAVAIFFLYGLKPVWRLASPGNCTTRCGNRDDCFFCQVLAVLYTTVPSIIMPIILFNNLVWLKVLIAPRLFLLEFIKAAIT